MSIVLWIYQSWTVRTCMCVFILSCLSIGIIFFCTQLCPLFWECHIDYLMLSNMSSLYWTGNVLNISCFLRGEVLYRCCIRQAYLRLAPKILELVVCLCLYFLPLVNGMKLPPVPIAWNQDLYIQGFTLCVDWCCAGQVASDATALNCF
jgi:hypothetical protein